MKNKNTLLKSILSCLLICCLFSVSFAATTQRWREILDELKEDWRTNDEIRQAMKDLWYNPDEYLWKSYNSTLKVINATNSSSSSSYTESTTEFWREIISQYRKKWWSNEEIKEFMQDLWLDTDIYFSSNSSKSYTSYQYDTWSTYISRSCKPYTVEYIQSLSVYTSPNLNKREYFVNIDYFKRYVDSKNVQSYECYVDWRISSSYVDTYNWTDRYTAPNWKVYFINEQNWSYSSNELSTAKSFSTIDELRNYIKVRNPLIDMWTINSQSQYSQQNIQPITVTSSPTLENIVQEVHSSAETTTSNTQTTEQSNNTQKTNNESQTEKEKDANIISNLRNSLFG